VGFVPIGKVVNWDCIICCEFVCIWMILWHLCVNAFLYARVGMYVYVCRYGHIQHIPNTHTSSTISTYTIHHTHYTKFAIHSSKHQSSHRLERAYRVDFLLQIRYEKEKVCVVVVCVGCVLVEWIF
jgi:hypothetical protein